MMNWNKVCNEVTCGGVILIYNSKENIIIKSPQICKSLKELYKTYKDYDYKILEECRNVFGKKLNAKLDELEKLYKLEYNIPIEKSEEVKNEINLEMINWYKAVSKTTKYVAVSLEDLMNGLKLNNEDVNDFVISKYYEK